MHETQNERNDHSLPPCWHETLTPDGQSYFFHAVTGETTWDRPKFNAPRLGANGPPVPQNDVRPKLSGSTTDSSQTYVTAYQAQPGYLHPSDHHLHPLQTHAPDMNHNSLQAPYPQHTFNILHSPHYSYDYDERSQQQQHQQQQQQQLDNVGVTHPSQQNHTNRFSNDVHEQLNNTSNGQPHDGRAPKGPVLPKPSEHNVVANGTETGLQTSSLHERLERMSFSKRADAAFKKGSPRASAHHEPLGMRTATRIPDTSCESPIPRYDTVETDNMPENCKDYEHGHTSESSMSTVNIHENEKNDQSKNNFDEDFQSTRNITESPSLANNVTHDAGMFVLDRKRVLTINLTKEHDYAWIKNGSMIARKGDIKFTRQGLKEQGIGRFLKKTVTREGLNIMKCQGIGTVLCADFAKVICVKHLHNSSISVNGNDVLALSPSLATDIRMNKGASILSGGPFNIRVSGCGAVAFTCHGDSMTLQASEESPVYTDPRATVAWSRDPEIETDLSGKSFIGKGTGEEFQLKFTAGYVVIQPYEEFLPS